MSNEVIHEQMVLVNFMIFVSLFLCLFGFVGTFPSGFEKGGAQM